MNLYIRQKVFTIGDRYQICDAAGDPVYEVEGELFSFGARFHLYDGQGRELLYIEQRLFHWLPRYTIYRDGQDIASIAKQFTLFGHRLTVESGYGHFELEGSVFGWVFQILCNGSPVAAIDKAVLSWGDAYELRIADGFPSPEFLCALVVAVDHCVHGND